MKFYFMRHAIAEEQKVGSYLKDADRHLTDEGIDKLKKICRGLDVLNIDWDVILTSPYVRAQETAKIVAGFFERDDKVHQCLALKPGYTIHDLLEEIALYEDFKNFILVGHEPSLSQYISLLTSGSQNSNITMKKAGVACVEFEGRPALSKGYLQWLLTPSIMMKLGKRN